MLMQKIFNNEIFPIYSVCFVLTVTQMYNFSHAGLATATYKYYNPNTCMFDAEGAYSSLQVCI